MYLKKKWAEWIETDVGRNADASRKIVSDDFICMPYVTIGLQA
jgi:hypothetical protein